MRICTLRDRRVASPRRLCATLLPILLLAAPAHAADGPDDRSTPPAATDDDDSGRDTLTIGGGVAYLPSYEGSNDYVATPVAALRARVSGIEIMTRGTQLSADLVRDSAGPGWKVMLDPPPT